MKLHLPQLAQNTQFSPDSRLWVYVCNRPLDARETAFAQAQLDAFCNRWTAHNQALKAGAEVFDGQFVLLMVDETQAGASGCSIDTSVHFLEKLGAELQVDFFERMRFAWAAEDGRLRFGNRQELADAVKNAAITDDTEMVNTLVQTKKDLQEKWLVPFNKSWHRRIAASH